MSQFKVRQILCDPIEEHGSCVNDQMFNSFYEARQGIDDCPFKEFQHVIIELSGSYPGVGWIVYIQGFSYEH